MGNVKLKECGVFINSKNLFFVL